MPVVIEPLGDHATTISFGDTIDEDINQQALSFFNCLKQQQLAGVKDIIPGYTSVTVVYDIKAIHEADNTVSAFEHIHHEIEKALQCIDEYKNEPERVMRIPVCYDVSLGI